VCMQIDAQICRDPRLEERRGKFGRRYAVRCGFSDEGRANSIKEGKRAGKYGSREVWNNE